MIGFAILGGMILGAVSWHIGLLMMEEIQRKHGCFTHCEYCGKPVLQSLASVIRGKRWKR